MKKASFPRALRAAGLSALPFMSAALVSLQGCTDLGETPVSAITPENFYRNEQEVIGGLASVYAELRNSLGDYYNISEVSSDEFIVPTRGQDWYDNGAWLELHRQTWSPTSPSALAQINGAWVNAFTGIARANVLLSALDNVTVANEAVVVAEVQTLRAFYYYMLMDAFGGVPIVETTEITPRARNTRAEVFAFIESELLEARDALPDQWPAASNGRLTKGAADALLAGIYLNAEVFTGTVTATGLQRGTNRWDDALDVADRILNSGQYTLEADWKANFRHDNHLSRENIFVVKHLNASGLGLNFPMRALHYNQMSPTPWNGFATIAETYYAFDVADERHEIFLVGQQYHLDADTAITDRSGAPLFYTPEIIDETQATEGEGVRIYKWPLDPNRVDWENSNDYAYFRLAEIYLIRAEALNELGRTPEAIPVVNTVRARVFEPDKPLPAGLSQAALRTEILKERLFELTAESKRRQDLIRHDRFTLPWSFKEQGLPFRILMPIPQSQMDANPLLIQNPGY